MFRLDRERVRREALLTGHKVDVDGEKMEGAVSGGQTELAEIVATPGSVEEDGRLPL